MDETIWDDPQTMTGLEKTTFMGMPVIIDPTLKDCDFAIVGRDGTYYYCKIDGTKMLFKPVYLPWYKRLWWRISNWWRALWT